MLKISLLFSGFLLVCFLIYLHIASGFKVKATIGWSLAKAACAQTVAYGTTKTLQSRLNDKSVFDTTSGTELCSKLTRTNCGSTSCKKFECKEVTGSSGSSGSSVSSGSKNVRVGPSENMGGIAPKGPTRFVEINGTYEYVLLFDVDNSRNTGELWYSTEYQKVTRTNEQILTKKTTSATLNVSGNAGVTGKLIDLINVEAAKIGGGADFGASLTKTLIDKKNKVIRSTDSSNYSIKANSSLVLYQLCFSGPGIEDRSDQITSNPIPDQQPITFTITYTFGSVLKDIKVVYSATDAEIPDDAISNYDSKEPTNLNHYTDSSTRVWLVPEWTEDLDSRVTYILNVHTYVPNNNYNSITAGTSTLPHYLKMIRNVREPQGIVHLKLWRTKNQSYLPSAAGFDFWTSDLSNGKEKDPSVRYFEYLCWKVKPVNVRT